MISVKNYEYLVNAVKANEKESIAIVSSNLDCSGFYIVKGSKRNEYKVIVENNVVVSCTCPHVHYRKIVCKHMIKVASITSFDINSIEVKKQP